MIDINEKYEKWTEKVMSGNSSYFMISKSNDNCWYFVSGKHAEPIHFFRIATDKGNGLCSEYEYTTKKKDPESIDFTIIVKDDNKMIIQVGNEKRAFGLKDVPCPANAIAIHCKVSHLHIFLFGSQASNTINTVLAPVIDSEDAIEDCMSRFYSALHSTKPIESEDEVKLDV